MNAKRLFCKWRKSRDGRLSASWNALLGSRLNTDGSGKPAMNPKQSIGKAVALAALALAVSSAHAVEPTALSAQSGATVLPDKIATGANESLAMIVPAKGVQIYECRARKDKAAEYEWAFVAPQADLFDANGNAIGRHYAGPHWQAIDGSTILGTVKERADAPKAGAIPWLLLAARPIGPEGAFGKVTSIQRVNTVGGLAPAAGCSQAAAGALARVPYTADYYFYTAT